MNEDHKAVADTNHQGGRGSSESGSGGAGTHGLTAGNQDHAAVVVVVPIISRPDTWTAY